jgi:hypothetical protein
VSTAGIVGVTGAVVATLAFIWLGIDSLIRARRRK